MEPPSMPTTDVATCQTPIVRGIRLVSPRELPDRLAGIFPFPLFNAIQSRSFPAVFLSNDNLVLSAPTGSGKTVVFELAIARAILQNRSSDFKIVHMAPLKALCSERKQDWQSKFSTLNINVGELTGDTESTSMSLQVVKESQIIVTTPEKWDSMTRRWKDHEKLVQMVRLLLIDEVHILDNDRGATLEAVVSRMKSRGSDLRLIALSATIPNCKDIAQWLGRSQADQHTPAILEEFGEDFRPVMLQKSVLAYDTSVNDFQFDALLTKKLPDIIRNFWKRKPVLIFCFTRASCASTAKYLADWATKQTEPPWAVPRRTVHFADKNLARLYQLGIAFHHAGLGQDDRLKIEQAFHSGNLGIICCTSTLAAGVNLPCYMVIIKGTMALEGGTPSELTDLEIMQMIGRAGRPQFSDSEGVAIIMTRTQREGFLIDLVNCKRTIESRLHLNMLEHLNAEVGLGFIKDVKSAVEWLSSTFLFVRLKKNPGHYRRDSDPLGYTAEQSITDICSKALDMLIMHDMLIGGPRVQQTGFGAAMSRYFVNFETMKGVVGLNPKPKVSEMLSAVCAAHELRDIRLGQNERTMLMKLDQHPSIRFPFKVNIEQSAQKVSLMIQALLGDVDIAAIDSKFKFHLNFEQTTALKHARRLIRCIVDCQVFIEDAVGIKNGLMLVRSLGAKVWDDSPLSMQQIASIGPVTARKLITAGIDSVEAVAECDASRLEMILSRNSPYGQRLHTLANDFPRPRLSISMVETHNPPSSDPLYVKIKAELGFLNERPVFRFNGIEVFVYFLAETSDGRKLDFARISATKIGAGLVRMFDAPFAAPHGALLTALGQTVNCYISCEELAGTQRSASILLKVPESAFSTVSPGAHPRRQEQTSSSGNRSRTQPGYSTDLEHFEWEDDAVDDCELAAAAEAAVESATQIQASRKTKHTVTADRSDGSNMTRQGNATPTAEQPERLPNGNWKCRHRCKDRKTCGHTCCTQGLESKPKPRPKQKADKSQGRDEPKQITQTHLTEKGILSLQLAQRPKRTLEQVDLSRTEFGSTLSKRPRGSVDTKVQTYGDSNDKTSIRTTSAELQNDDTTEQDEDEFEGFDDIDFDFPLPEPLEPPLGLSGRVTTRGVTERDADSVEARGPTAVSVLSDEESLNAALVGLEDSLLLEGVIDGRRTDGVSRDRMVSSLGDDKPTGTASESEEMANLKAFLWEQFGDIVELV